MGTNRARSNGLPRLDLRDVEQCPSDVLAHVVDVLPLFLLHRRAYVIHGDLGFVEQVLNDEHGR